MFYKTPADLSELEDLVMLVGREMGMRSNGYGTAGMLEEYLPQAVDGMRRARERLLTSGRAKDLKAFRKHLLSAGRFLDNRAYNYGFQPMVAKHLAD